MDRLLIVVSVTLLSMLTSAQTGKEIITKLDQKLRGETSIAQMKITIVRAKWTREMTMKSWTKGTDYSTTLVLAPAKEKGTVFLKRGNEVWNWVPSIERSIKMPPSMMMQSWMGTDFTNDDLVKQSSLVVDYDQKVSGNETLSGLDCWKVELMPKEDAAVVWGKIVMWVDKKDYMQVKTEFYDEDEFLVNEMNGSNFKDFGGKMLPGKIEYIPVEKKGQKTQVEYQLGSSISP